MSSKCYAPDGTQTNGWQPCNSTTNGRVSACCDLRDSVCTTSGLCVSGNGYYYRAGCTDQSWKSDNCPAQCAKTKPHSFVNFYPCVLGMWDFPHMYCCGEDDKANCCNQSFSMTAGLPFFPANVDRQALIAGKDPTISTISSAPVSSLTSSATADAVSSCPTSKNSATTVGAAIGSSLSVVLIAVIILFVIRERRWQRSVKSTKTGLSHVNRGQEQNVELKHQLHPPVEMSESGARHELPEKGSRFGI